MVRVVDWKMWWPFEKCAVALAVLPHVMALLAPDTGLSSRAQNLMGRLVLFCPVNTRLSVYGLQLWRIAEQ
jgi:hypothetical protein